jgi:hypothetical protein
MASGVISGRVPENEEAVAADGVRVDALVARAANSPSRRPPIQAIQARTLSSIEDEIYKPACPTWRAACHPHPGAVRGTICTRNDASHSRF